MWGVQEEWGGGRAVSGKEVSFVHSGRRRKRGFKGERSDYAHGGKKSQQLLKVGGDKTGKGPKEKEHGRKNCGKKFAKEVHNVV